MRSRHLPRAIALAALATLVIGAGAAPGAGNDAAQRALDHAKENKAALGLNGSDVAVQDVVTSAQTGATYVYLVQQHQGIDVHAAIVNLAVTADGRVVSAASSAADGLPGKASGRAEKSAADAALIAGHNVASSKVKGFEVVRAKGGAAKKTTISAGGIASRPIEAELRWYRTGDGIRLAWMLELDLADSPDAWNVFVDAQTGEVLAKESLVVHESAAHTAQALSTRSQSGSATSAAIPSFPATDGASYRVFPLPLESPTDGPRSLVTNVAEPTASPFGWHDTDGAPGPEFTITRGNNVHAYADRTNTNTPDPGSEPDGGPSLVFDHPLDLEDAPVESQHAMVTNLFYWNNVVHDVFYGYGFDEASGNFQTNNYGRGGAGNDYVQAEAQDGSGRNNANFATFADNGTLGSRPRMQMYEWRSALPNPLVINTGSAAGTTFYGPMAGFGDSLVTTGPITGDLVWVGRACSPAYQAGVPLDALEGDPAGKIAVTERGICTFTSKVKRLQDAGAKAVIVINNAAGPPLAMGGSDPTVSIPSIMVSLDDRAALLAALPANATLSDGTGGAPDRDSDLDAAIIGHEYAHGISNRLTGGRLTVSCLNSATVLEHMGEGWSDFIGMVLTTDPSDTPTTPRGVGTYVSFQGADGLGIRPTQYTTDMSVNPSTYDTIKDTVNISQPHGVGYVWNTMLWEVYWNLVAKHGYNPDVYADWSEGGNNLAIQLVIEGLKLQPCMPGFVTGRDAILKADDLLTGDGTTGSGANQCAIWRGFAKRGLGASANQGSSLSRTDGTQAFDLPATCTAQFGGFTSPVKAPPAFNAATAGQSIPVKFTLAENSGLPKDAAVFVSQQIDCSTLAPVGGVSSAHGPGSTGLESDGDEYQFNWKTDRAWSGTCRQLIVRLQDVSDPVAYFRFR